MSIDTLQHLRRILDPEPGTKGLAVMVGRDVYQVNQVVISTEGVILRCAPTVPEPAGKRNYASGLGERRTL